MANSAGLLCPSPPTTIRAYVNRYLGATLAPADALPFATRTRPVAKGELLTRYGPVPVNGMFHDADLMEKLQPDSIYELFLDPQWPELATFQVVTSHMWLVATELNCTDTEQFHHSIELSSVASENNFICIFSGCSTIK